MLSAAGRRLPAASRRALAHPQQARAFLGLRELLFGGKDKPAADEPAKPAVASQPKPTPTSNANNAPNNAAATAPIKEEAVEETIITGSQDELQYSVGKYARLADGAVLASRGKTLVLATVVSESGSASAARDYLPLMVDYRVKAYAVGRIPDTVRRREFTGGDEEILQSRVVDRVLRPLLPRDYFDDTQVLATVQSLDPTNDPLVVAVNAASAALMVSDIPFAGPAACVRVIELDGQLVVNPTAAQREAATLDVLYAATESRTLMIEAEGDEIPEQRVLEALELAQTHVVPLVKAQQQLAKKLGKPKRTYRRGAPSEEVMAKARELGMEEAQAVLSGASGNGRHAKTLRQDGERHVFGKIISGLREEFAGQPHAQETHFQLAAHDVFQQALRSRILSPPEGRPPRYDGRAPNTIRTIALETDVLPMAHGSAVFSRGDTQALCAVTLGPLDRGLRVRGSLTASEDAEASTKHAMLHYEFPPYCVNETGKMGGVNRRMVGHGALAEKALARVVPSIDEFPYTVRMTSEIMGSDGSSSMATVCGVSMALMDAGVPIRAPVAGISMGLVTAGDPFDAAKPIGSGDFRLLTDILGTEDHYGDMDFKVAGTDAGITAIQLDVKLPGGVPLEILARAVHFAKKARANLLRKMSGAIAAPRAQLKAELLGEQHVSLEFVIPTTSIGALIGTGGANVREIEQSFDCAVHIDRHSGVIRVVAPRERAESAKQHILAQLGHESIFRKGERYTMRVTELLDFGALLEAPATKSRGFVHISELSPERVVDIREALTVGQELEFECLQDGVSGKMSRKAVLATGGGKTDPKPDTEATSTATTTNAADSTETTEAEQPKATSHHRRPVAQSQGGKRRGKTAVSTAKSMASRHAGHRRASKGGAASADAAN